jgi:hypothetical protein
MDKVSSDKIKITLAEKHSRDFFMTEVKSGSTWMGTADRILDAIAIKKSFARPWLIGYEIKISRSDFKRDIKYFTYLPLAHELFIVSPTGLVRREELPVEIGLVWYNPETGRVTTVKKPPPRDIKISVDMLLYIIYSRLESDRMPFHSSRAEYFRDWLANKNDNRLLGPYVSKRINEMMDELKFKARQSDVYAAHYEKSKDIINVLRENGMPQYERDPAGWLKNFIKLDCFGMLFKVEKCLHSILEDINGAKDIKLR